MGSSLTSGGSAVEAVSLTTALGGLLQALTALLLLGALMFWLLRVLAKRGLGPLAQGFAHVEQRAALDGQNGLLIVRVEGRRLLLATHPRTPARLLLELDSPRDTPQASPSSASNLP